MQECVTYIWLCIVEHVLVVTVMHALNAWLCMHRYINEDKITIYVEHPVPLAPPVAETPAPPMPLMLTAKEKKKIRKQRREEREKERQV